MRLPLHLGLYALVCLLLLPGAAAPQILFGWPVRAQPQPEAVLGGAGAVFWNPGALPGAMGTPQEAWIIHVDGPDITGIRGVAAAVTVDLPGGMRGAVGYLHLGIPDIPRTTTSPEHLPGGLQVAEDAAVVAVAGGTPLLAVGGSLRAHRGSMGTESRSRLEGDLGAVLQPRLPLRPRLGLAVQGMGRELDLLGGAEVELPPLIRGQALLRLGYGVRGLPSSSSRETRFSLRGSWQDRIHAGVGLSRGGGGGWNPLWMVGFDAGRYSLSVLREGLAGDLGPVHYYRAAIRFP